ncbi:hypothetical protein BLOT_015295 [Blomia tropicalis]|nr:hypothetical protein BLOT_015295 [Blomia tropicalis]
MVHEHMGVDSDRLFDVQVFSSSTSVHLDPTVTISKSKHDLEMVVPPPPPPFDAKGDEELIIQ